MSQARQGKEEALAFTPHAFKETVLASTPVVWMTPEVLDDIRSICSLLDDEVSWLGDVERTENGDFFVHEVFVPKQSCSGASTEMSEEGLADLAQEIMEKYDSEQAIEVLNSLRLWGHNHPHMSTSPSKQDEDQMDLFLTNQCEWFLRCITHKGGRMEYTLFDFENNVRVNDVRWRVYYKCDSRKEHWAKVVKEKVTCKVFTYTGKARAHSGPANAYGYGGTIYPGVPLPDADADPLPLIPQDASMDDVGEELHAMNAQDHLDQLLIDNANAAD